MLTTKPLGTLAPPSFAAAGSATLMRIKKTAGDFFSSIFQDKAPEKSQERAALRESRKAQIVLNSAKIEEKTVKREKNIRNANKRTEKLLLKENSRAAALQKKHPHSCKSPFLAICATSWPYSMLAENCVNLSLK